MPMCCEDRPAGRVAPVMSSCFPRRPHGRAVVEYSVSRIHGAPESSGCDRQLIPAPSPLWQACSSPRQHPNLRKVQALSQIDAFDRCYV